MRAELVAVGTELLLGDIVDTNSGWISSRLAEIGVDVHRHTSVGDNVERVAAVLAEAAGRADAVIVTGGLGPTADDLTREAVARMAGVAQRRRPELVADLRSYFLRLGRDMPQSNLLQADLPEGARPLPAVGSAPGFAIEVGGALVCCVPGVPAEMEEMVARDVVPLLVQRGGLAATVSRTVRTAGMAEAAVGEAVAPVAARLEAGGNPTLAYLASKGETRVRVTGKAATREAALALIDPVVTQVAALLGDAVVGLDEEGVASAIGRCLRARGWTLAVAESVSGGYLGARLVEVPGASDWFRGGVLVYASDTKVSVGGVDPAVLMRFGPVSVEVAGALAAGVRERLGASVGLGVVGVAGPASQNGRDVGTLCLGLALPDATVTTTELRLPARGRRQVQEWAASRALDVLRRRLTEPA